MRNFTTWVIREVICLTVIAIELTMRNFATWVIREVICLTVIAAINRELCLLFSLLLITWKYVIHMPSTLYPRISKQVGCINVNLNSADWAGLKQYHVVNWQSCVWDSPPSHKIHPPRQVVTLLEEYINWSRHNNAVHTHGSHVYIHTYTDPAHNYVQDSAILW